MALGAGGASYSAPTAIANLKKRWELLPAVWADKGDSILAQAPASTPTIRQLIEEKHLEIVSGKKIGQTDAIPDPWGWNRSIRNELQRYGISASRMPDNYTLERWRDLAHRKTALHFHSFWREEFDEMPVELPAVCCNVEDALRAAAQFGNSCIKLPWSSSGRGVWFSDTLNESKLRSIAEGAIKRQGAVIVEKAETVALDFATEWECRLGECRFLGFSLFLTEKAGYSGNLSAPQEEIIGIIDQTTNIDVIPLIERQQKILNEVIAPHYEGLFGVDLLVTADGRINPCVEINLRRTMGHATLAWWKETEQRGLFPAIVFT